MIFVDGAIVAGGSARYLSFELGGGQYAVEVERVEVVLETVPITRVPKAASHLCGVINYRGSVIPVADLRSRFSETSGAEIGASAAASHIIVLHIDYAGGDLVVGVVADAVREVVDLDPGKIERAPRLGERGGSNLIAGIGEKDGRFIVILDLDAAFAEEGAAFSGERRADERRADERPRPTGEGA